MPVPDSIHLWLPRANEHDLAQSLGMVDCGARELSERLREFQQAAAHEYQGVPVRIHRWHIFKVVRVMAELGVTNTPDGRDAAFGLLANRA